MASLGSSSLASGPLGNADVPSTGPGGAGDQLLLSTGGDSLLLDSDLTDVLLLKEADLLDYSPLGMQRLDNQFAVVAASRLDGVLQ